MAQAKGDRLGELARDHRIIGRPHADDRRGSDLELLPPELAQKRVRYHADLPHGRQQRLAERSLATVAAEIIGLPGLGRNAAIGELLLEGGEQLQTRLALQPLDRTAQDVPGTETPTALRPSS